MCYGQALADGGKPLFSDDTPKAWPFGPVFPRTYKRYEEQQPENLTEEMKQRFAEDADRLRMIAATVSKYSHVSALRLSEWSHTKGSPWWITVFDEERGTGWNREITPEIIKDYFSNPSWQVGI